MQVFPLTNVVMVLQMGATWAILQPLLDLNYVSFPRFSWGKARWVSFRDQLVRFHGLHHGRRQHTITQSQPSSPSA